MELNLGYIDSLAPNTSSISNAKSLIGKFLKLCITEDESLLFGDCSGSGKKPYTCSVDFIDHENPISRCTCPSRQIPCKHALGLMYAYAQGKQFNTEAIPEDIVIKREKIEKRNDNKEKRAKIAKTASKETQSDAKLSKAKINTAIKRIETQLEGIEIATLLIKNILNTGIAGMDATELKNLELQTKNLGNYYIGGIQNAFNDIIISIKGQKESDYEKTIEALLYMSILIKKAKEHLESKKESEEKLKLNISTSIEEQIGHIWTLDELIESNMYIENAQLIQLAFYCYDDASRHEYVDQAFYFCLNDKNIYITYNYRPYKALKYIKEENSCYELITMPELYIYPGDINPRIRWNKYTMNNIDEVHINKIINTGRANYTEVIKAVKNQIKNPLSNKNPVFLLKVFDVVMINDESGTKQLHIVDEKGVKQVLQDKGYVEVQSVSLLKRLDKKLLIGNVLLVMYINDIESGLLTAKPLALITNNEILRLVY